MLKKFIMFFSKEKTANNKHIYKEKEIDCSLMDVKYAWRKWYDSKNKNISSKSIIKDDNSIDFHYLAPFLGGIPNQNFYQSKETGEIFEEKDMIIAQESDVVQKAVDRYYDLNRKLPVIGSEQMVNYYLLLNGDIKYLNKKPQTQFYITKLENLISHIPQKK